MKKIYVIPEISTTKVVVGRMIAGSFKGQLGTEGMSGEEVLVKEEFGNPHKNDVDWEEEPEDEWQ